MAEQKIPVNLQDAETAMKDFFNLDEQGKAKEPAANPAKKVLDKLENDAASPDRKSVHTVDASKPLSGDQTQELSVDDAQSIVDREKTYDEILKEYEVKNSEIFAVVDMILEKGYYQEQFTFGKFSFALQSQKVYSIDNISSFLDQSNMVTQGAIAQASLERRLAASLVMLQMPGGSATIFEHTEAEDDSKVLEIIKSKVSSPIYTIMLRKLNKFEILVGLSSRDEAIDRFLAPTTA